MYAMLWCKLIVLIYRYESGVVDDHNFNCSTGSSDFSRKLKALKSLFMWNWLNKSETGLQF